MKDRESMFVAADPAEQNMADAFEFVTGKIQHQSLVVLYGLGNQGKTSTLTDLVFLLTNPSVKSYIRKNLIKTKKNGYKDGYYVLRYKNKNIFISTYGDGRIECERNIQFFERKKLSAPIYVIDGKDVYPLNSRSQRDQKEKYYNVIPDFLISACRTEGGSVDATMYLAKKVLPYIRQEAWIRKLGVKDGENPVYPNPRTLPFITKDDDRVARDIKAFIDRVKDCIHCI